MPIEINELTIRAVVEFGGAHRRGRLHEARGRRRRPALVGDGHRPAPHARHVHARLSRPGARHPGAVEARDREAGEDLDRRLDRGGGRRPDRRRGHLHRGRVLHGRIAGDRPRLRPVASPHRRSQEQDIPGLDLLRHREGDRGRRQPRDRHRADARGPRPRDPGQPVGPRLPDAARPRGRLHVPRRRRHADLQEGQARDRRPGARHCRRHQAHGARVGYRTCSSSPHGSPPRPRSARSRSGAGIR